MTKLLFTLVLALSAMCLALGWAVDHQYSQAKALRAENQTLTEAANRAQEAAKRDRRISVARQAKIASQARKLAQAQEALSEALQRNKAWSDTDVPDEVQKALTGRSGAP